MADVRMGLDVGGTGTKGALVDLETGTIVSERIRIPTPDPATPDAMIEVMAEVVDQLDHQGGIGVGFPAVVRDGLVSTANNIHDDCIGENFRDLLHDATGREVVVVNDADVAAIAECRFGAARGVLGKVLVLTFGTGIGSGLIVDGHLTPNIEVGQMEFESARPVEDWFSARAREDRGIGWDEWGADVARLLNHLNSVFTPRLTVFGGGASKSWDEFSDQLGPELDVVRAELRNNAGIVGAATLAPV
jgi:polyphosphate glucokinase